MFQLWIDQRRPFFFFRGTLGLALSFLFKSTWVNTSSVSIAYENFTVKENDDVYQFDFNSTNRFLFVDFTRFACGTKNLCNKTIVPENGFCRTFCSPCGCDEDCHVYGDCCPDVLFKDSPHTPSSPSEYVSCSTDTWTKFGNLSSILMVTTCPANSIPNIVRKCERPDIKNRSEATPVSVVKLGTTYRNVFCAQCHSASDTTPWYHRATCELTANIKGAKTKADLWRFTLAAGKRCEIVTYPPDGILPRGCVRPEYESCNATGEWQS